MSLAIVLLVFYIGLLLYIILAGADFGAGIIELMMRRNDRQKDAEEVVSLAMAPVWEANHVWLILAVVILFTAFPGAFHDLSTVFHVPLVLMLFGIVLRGCAFTFRHYDPFEDKSRRHYSAVFIASSVLTPLTQGVIAGALLHGAIPNPSSGFYQYFIAPWFSFFALSVGVFFSVLCALLAAVFLTGETRDVGLQKNFLQVTWRALAACAVAGLFVFLAAEVDGLSLFYLFWHSSGVFAVLPAALALILLIFSLRTGRFLLARLAVGALVSSVMLGWFMMTFPYFVGGHAQASYSLSLYDVVAPESTLRQLVVALAVGSLIIFPSLAYLLRTFKSEQGSSDVDRVTEPLEKGA